jgi:hypothetical protein
MEPGVVDQKAHRWFLAATWRYAVLITGGAWILLLNGALRAGVVKKKSRAKNVAIGVGIMLALRRRLGLVMSGIPSIRCWRERALDDV